MPIYLPTNQYAGVNAHLHSVFQLEGDWSTLHSVFNVVLARHLSRQLPPGYQVSIERSLQIRAFHPDTGERIRYPKPDVSVFRAPDAPRFSQPGAAQATLLLPVVDTIAPDDESFYRAVTVYQVIEHQRHGQPVMQLELLSPTNKGGGDGFLQYREKRILALHGGLVLVEIDLLHALRSAVYRLPLYPVEADSFPYTVTVNNPRPTFAVGQTEIYGFAVDTALPTCRLPLGDGALIFDFDPVYQETFASLPIFADTVDYAAPPPRLATYSAADQQRIAAVMQRAAAHGA